ncbi:MAG: EAL domain-containing protein [Pseudomonadota bacterium]
MSFEAFKSRFMELTSDPVAIGYIAHDADNARVVYVNSAFSEELGYAAHDVVGKSVDAYHDSETWHDFISAVRPHFAAGDPSFTADAVLIRADGSRLWASASFVVVEEQESQGRYVCATFRDISAFKEAEAVAEKARALLAAAINAFPDPFAIYDKDHALLVWNPAYARSMTDAPDDLKPGIGLKALLLEAARSGRVPEAIGREEEWVEEYYTPDVLAPGVEDFEFRGDRHFRMVRSRTEKGENVVLRLDVSEVVRHRRAAEEYARQLEAANRAIMEKALRDDLTGLGNRRLLTQKLEEFVERKSGSDGEIAVLQIDLDRFKQINDTMGHAAGDHVLVETAKRILDLVEIDDVVSRIGGDEFIALLYVSAGSRRPERLAKSLIASLSRPAHFEGKECRFGASVGLARTPLSDPDELLVNSDLALYKAKRQGRGRLGIFDRADFEEARQNKTLADEIMRGLENAEFLPFYQPQVDAQTGEIVGLEALARWAHPDRGIVSPSGFLRIATDLNVAADIDRMIFERAICECSQFFRSHLAPPSLSFNVSAKRVVESDFDAIRRSVEAYPGQVCFELLETIFLEEESDAFLFHLDRLREFGIGLEIDDFGSGRASVVALQRIGPDRLKIDRRLVAPVSTSSKSHRLLRSIVDIGLALDIEIVAEGVETREQAEILAQLGCNRLQGFLFAAPMALSGVFELFSSSEGLVEARPTR